MLTTIIIVIAVLAGLLSLYYCVDMAKTYRKRKAIYQRSLEEMCRGDYRGAEEGFRQLGKFNFKKSLALAEQCKANIPKQIFKEGVEHMKQGKYDRAIECFSDALLADNAEARDLLPQCREMQREAAYQDGLKRMRYGDYDKAEEIFGSLWASRVNEEGIEEKAWCYKDSDALQEECRRLNRPRELQGCYASAASALEAGRYPDAKASLDMLPDGYRGKITLTKRLYAAIWESAAKDMERGEYARAKETLDILPDDYKTKATYMKRLYTTMCKSIEKVLENGNYFQAKRILDELPDDYKGKMYEAFYEEAVKCMDGKGAHPGDYEATVKLLSVLPRGYRDTDDRLRSACQVVYGSEFCADSPSYRHQWKEVFNIVEVDSDVRRMGHGRNICLCCGKKEDFSYDYDPLSNGVSMY